MVIDTSALVAILAMEPEAAALSAAIERDPRRLLSAGTLQEARMVVAVRFGEPRVGELELLLHEIEVEVVAVTDELAQWAFVVWQRWGKGRHPAGLNYGDCFAAALALQTREPLLFKGKDFAHPDVTADIAPVR